MQALRKPMQRLFAMRHKLWILRFPMSALRQRHDLRELIAAYGTPLSASSSPAAGGKIAMRRFDGRPRNVLPWAF